MTKTYRILAFLLATLGAAASAGAQTLGWSAVQVPGPGQRHSQAMAYDAARGVTVLFGGLDGDRTNGKLVGDTWEFDGDAWTRVATSGPSARLGAAMAHDAARGVVVLFGGNDGTYRNDTWEWDGARWRRASTTGPSVRGRHAMAYDSARGVTVLFGGNPRSLGDTWEWNGSKWRQVATTGPVGRSRTAMAYDVARKRTVLFAGLDSSNQPLGDTWEWDGVRWVQVALTGATPRARSRHPLVYDARAGVCRVFSGNAGPNLRDTWEWNGSAWQQVASSGPPPRMYHGMVHQEARGTTLVFGGFDLSVALADTWEYAAAPPCRMPRAYGCETPHCNGAARLSAASCPHVGNAAFAIEVSNGVPDLPPPAVSIVLASSLAAANQSVPCSSTVSQRLCIDVVPIGLAFPVATDARGRGSWPLPIPNASELRDLRLFCQLVSFHATHNCACLVAPGNGFTSSKGLEVRIQ